jgi:hypothetical protein
MSKSYLSLDQLKEIASTLQLRQAKTFLLGEAGKIGVVVKETLEKVRRLKNSAQIGVSPFYVEEQDVLTITLQPVDGTDEDAIVGYIPLKVENRQALLEALKKSSDQPIGIEFYSVSENLEEISIRNVLIEEMSRFVLQTQLNRIKD